MKKLCVSAIILSMIGASFLYGDELSEKKARLEKQIAELEAQQNKQKEIKELERELQQLQSKADEELSSKNSSSYQSPQPTQQTTQTPYQNPYTSDTTQEINDEEESKKIFGKNRSGVLLGLAGGAMPIEYRAKDGTHSAKGSLVAGGVRLGYQYFRNNNSILGFRLYLDEHIAMNQTEDALTEIQQDFMAFNLDILVDVRIPNTYTYVGLFGGVGIGSLDFETISSIGRSDLSLKQTGGFYNFGAALTFAAKHRLELYCKMPAQSSYDGKYLYWKTSTLVTLAYQYTF